jgi:hydroxypyruvate isomerase
MHRRKFLEACAVSALASPVLPWAATAAHPAGDLSPRPVPRATSEFPEGASLAGPVAARAYPMSVMLWTVRTDLPFDQRLEKVAEAGYHATQLVNEYKDWSNEDFVRYRRKRESLGITFDAVSGINHSLCDPAQRPALLQEIQAHLNVMEQLQSSRLILLSGNRIEGVSHAQTHADCVETVKAVADLAAAKNVEILLENIDPIENPNYFLTSIAEIFQVAREVNHPNVKVLYDFFHEQIAEGNLIAKLQPNIDLIALVHVADVPGRHEPGTGEINYSNIFKKLHELNYRGNIAMEFMPTGDTVKSLKAARMLASRCSGGSSDPCVSAAILPNHHDDFATTAFCLPPQGGGGRLS